MRAIVYAASNHSFCHSALFENVMVLPRGQSLGLHLLGCPVKLRLAAVPPYSNTILTFQRS